MLLLPGHLRPRWLLLHGHLRPRWLLLHGLLLRRMGCADGRLLQRTLRLLLHLWMTVRRLGSGGLLQGRSNLIYSPEAHPSVSLTHVHASSA